MANFKELSTQITQSLDTILPQNIRCVVVLVDVDEGDVCAVSDMSDEDASSLLAEAVDVLKTPDLTQKIDTFKVN